MRCVIKSIVFNDYFVGIEPMKNNHFKLYWSQHKDEAKVFKSVKKLNEALTLIHGLIEEELELKVIEVEDE